MANVKLEDLPSLTLADDTLLYGEEEPYTALGHAGKFLLSSLDGRYNALYVQIAGDTMTGNLDMDDNNITNIEQATFNLTPATSPGIGQLQWNETDGTLEVGALGGNVVLQIGQESHGYMVQRTGSTIPNGKSVFIIGASGNRPEIALTDISAGRPIDVSIGLTTEEIANSQRGYVATFGLVRGIDTSAWSEGDIIWCDPDTAGDLTNVRPTAPDRPVFIGIVVTVSATIGSIFISPFNISNLSLLADVFVPSTPNDGDYLRWNTANARWQLSAT